jgi:hypothetical protein
LGTSQNLLTVLKTDQAVSQLTKDLCMLFMIIERFNDNDMLPIYKRVRDDGRLLPDGLTYIDSWIEPNFSRCFQLMECDDLRLLQQWTLSWRGSGATFEIVPVVSSKDTREREARLGRLRNRYRGMSAASAAPTAATEAQEHANEQKSGRSLQ